MKFFENTNLIKGKSTVPEVSEFLMVNINSSNNRLIPKSILAPLKMYSGNILHMCFIVCLQIFS